VETALDQTWVQRGIVIGESDQEALEIAEAALGRYMEHLLDARVKFNPGGNTYRDPSRPPPDSEVLEHAFLAGTAGTVAEQIAELKEAGVRNLMLNFNVGQIPKQHVERSLEVFGKKVLPRFSDAPTMSR
jgi:alkanesulfonate monooxygenase SsuD/methylene tetrahydromethanopterin reductase-like flavin-dependent oxidoreductase (luciferase family)